MKKILAVLMLGLALCMSGCIVYEDDYYEPHRGGPHHSGPRHPGPYHGTPHRGGRPVGHRR